jgi:XTP/dITP diphosphohydrolase/tetrapyrrole methylase family protein/MazG family protein
VAQEINDKLVRRHPHVFGDHGKLDTAGEVITKWEQIKATEKKNGPAQSGVFKELPPRLPALMFAEAVMKQVEKKALPAAGVVDGAAIAAQQWQRMLGDQRGTDGVHCEELGHPCPV